MQDVNWTPVLCVKIPAVPVGQPRARATVRKFGNKVSAGVYDVTTIKCADGSKKPHPIVLFKASVRHAVQKFHDAAPLESPLKIHIKAVFPRPKSMLWKTKPMPRTLHTSTPDADNVTKAIQDAVNKILWRDDSQVAIETCEKWIAAGDEQPHVVLSVWKFVEGQR